MSKKVIISVLGGVATVEEKSKDVEVIIIDYDVEGIEEEFLQEDEDGEEYNRIEFPAEEE